MEGSPHAAVSTVTLVLTRAFPQERDVKVFMNQMGVNDPKAPKIPREIEDMQMYMDPSAYMFDYKVTIPWSRVHILRRLFLADDVSMETLAMLLKACGNLEEIMPSILDIKVPVVNLRSTGAGNKIMLSAMGDEDCPWSADTSFDELTEAQKKDLTTHCRTTQAEIIVSRNGIQYPLPGDPPIDGEYFYVEDGVVKRRPAPDVDDRGNLVASVVMGGFGVDHVVSVSRKVPFFSDYDGSCKVTVLAPGIDPGEEGEEDEDDDCGGVEETKAPPPEPSPKEPEKPKEVTPPPPAEEEWTTVGKDGKPVRKRRFGGRGKGRDGRGGRRWRDK